MDSKPSIVAPSNLLSLPLQRKVEKVLTSRISGDSAELTSALKVFIF